MSIRRPLIANYFPAIGMAILIISLALPGCNTAPPECKFSYQQQHSGNVSTIVWPVDSARDSTHDAFAPNFKWMKSDGTLDSLGAHRGQVVLLNFWASWCGPCTAEMPTIQSIADQLGDSLFVIGVAVDACSPWSSVSGFIQRTNIKYQIALDSEWALYEKYIPDAFSINFPIPQSVFIGKDGKVRDVELGEGDRQELLSRVYSAEK